MVILYLPYLLRSRLFMRIDREVMMAGCRVEQPVLRRSHDVKGSKLVSDRPPDNEVSLGSLWSGKYVSMFYIFYEAILIS